MAIHCNIKEKSDFQLPAAYRQVMALSVAVLRNRDFRLLLATRLLGLTALQAQAVIVGWQVYTLTHNPFMLGLVGLAEAVPALLCALFAGHWVDMGRPFRIYVGCLSVMALNMVMLLAVGGGMVALSEHTLLLALFAGVFISGLARSFVMPASSTLLARFVPRPQIAAASAWLSSGFQVAAICGPAAAGLIYGGYGPRAAWVLPAVFMSLAVVFILQANASHRQHRNNATPEPAMQSIQNGWRFILKNRVLLSVMALDMLAVLFGGAIAMLPAFADRVLHTGSEGLGLLRAAPAAGSILTAMWMALRPPKVIRATWLLWMVTGFGVSIIGFGLSTVFWLAAVFLALSGAFDSVSMVIRGTLMQLLTPDAMRGRVSSVNSMFIISSNELGAFESGVAASLLGLVPSIVIGGIGTLLVVAATALFSPNLRRTVVDATSPND